MVHFPVNILALRTVHKYERMDSFEEDDTNPGTDDEDGEDSQVVSMWSRDCPIASEESGEYKSTFPSEKDFENRDSESAVVNGTDLANEPPLSPIEKKIRMAGRRKKLPEDGEKEWVTAIESNSDQLA